MSILDIAALTPWTHSLVKRGKETFLFTAKEMKEAR